MSAVHCPNCFLKNEYRGIKPTICQYCKEPFVKAFVKASEAPAAPRRERTPEPKRTAYRHVRGNVEEDDDGPMDLDLSAITIRTEGGGTSKLGSTMIASEETLKRQDLSFERQSVGGGEGLESFDKTKRAILENMLKPVTR